MAVIGFEEIGGLYARIIHESDKAELVGVFDYKKELAKPIAEEYNCKLYTSLEELMDDDEVEAVNICLIDKYHLVVSEIAAKAGKHILLDKPIAKTFKEANEIKRICQDANVRLMIAHLTAYLKQTIIAKEKYENGELGDLIQLSLRHHTTCDLREMMQGTVNLALFLGIHDIFTAQYVFGKKISSVYAISSKKKNQCSEDCIITSLKYEDGSIGVIETGWQYPISYPSDIFSIVINGTKQTVTSDSHISSFKMYGERFTNVDLIDCYEFGGRIQGAIIDLLVDFVQGVLQGKEFIVKTEEAIDSLLVTEGVLESLDKGIPVEINR